MESKVNTKYDLQERTLFFSKEIIKLCKLISKNQISIKVMDQLIRSATSIGANYREAVNASSKKDFRNKLFICKKETQETSYWLDLLLESEPSMKEQIDPLIRECHELNLIFQKSINTLNANLKIDN